MMKLADLTDDDLAALLEGFRAVALTGNRAAMELFSIVEREMLTRRQSTEIAHYTDDELAGALVMLTRAVDASRAGGVPDDYPAVQFLLVTITDLAGEVESRGLIRPIQ